MVQFTSSMITRLEAIWENYLPFPLCKLQISMPGRQVRAFFFTIFAGIVAFTEGVVAVVFRRQYNRGMVSQDQLPCGPTRRPSGATVKKRSLAWFGHVTSHDSLSKTFLQGTLESGRCRGRQRKCWMDNVKEWTSPPAHGQSCSQRLPAEKTGRGSLLNRPTCPPDDPIGQGTEPKGTVVVRVWSPKIEELHVVVMNKRRRATSGREGGKVVRVSYLVFNAKSTEKVLLTWRGYLTMRF